MILLGLGPARGLPADGIIQTLVGSGLRAGMPALGAPFGLSTVGVASGLAVDAVGNLYVSVPDANQVWRVDSSTQEISLLAGTGQSAFGGDGGPAVDAALNAPSGLFYRTWVTMSGVLYEQLYVCDTYNNRIRAIDLRTGLIRTLAGTGANDGGGDHGPALLASLDQPVQVCVDELGGQICVIEGGGLSADLKVRMFTEGGPINTVAGNGLYASASNPSADDGASATSASLLQATSLALYNGELYIGENTRIRTVGVPRPRGPLPADYGIIGTYAGAGSTGVESGDGALAKAAGLGQVTGMAVDAGGNLYFSDANNQTLRRVDAVTLKISRVAGTPRQSGYGGDGNPAIGALLDQPMALCLGGDGDLYFSDFFNEAVRRVSNATQRISTLVGGPSPAGNTGTSVALTGPQVLARLPDGDLIFDGAPSPGHQLLRYRAGSGTVGPFAGTGGDGHGGDGGPATSAQLRTPAGIAADAAGNVYISDNADFTIRKVDGGGTISTFAGTGSAPGAPQPDGLTATVYAFNLDGPLALTDSNLYEVDSDNDIRAIGFGDRAVHTLYRPNSYGFADGPLSTTALTGSIAALASDPAHNCLYLCDSDNNAVRRVDLGALTMTTVCGLGPGRGGISGDGFPATQAALNRPRDVWVDAQGDLFIADTGNNRVRRVDLASGIISTVVGSGYVGFGGDGQAALLATLDNPMGGAVLPSGDLVFCDSANNRVRQVTYPKVPVPATILDKPIAYPSPADRQVCLSFIAGQAGPVTVEVYSVALRMVARFTDNAAAAGPQNSCADVSQLARGPYLYRILATGTQAQTGKFKVMH